MIYHQTMTPTWLEAHASYIDSSRSKTSEQLTFNTVSVSNAALLKVPMIPAGMLQYSSPVTIKIVASHDIGIGTTYDSDLSYGVSDGTSYVGFKTFNKGDGRFPFRGYEGTSGTTLTGITAHSYSSPSDKRYPGQYIITLKLDEHWGSCYIAHDGGFVKTAVYNNRLMIDKGLTLEVYKEDGSERAGIKYIEVTVIQDN